MSRTKTNTASRLAAELLQAETMRQAECAAMLIAVTRMLLDLRGRDFAAWLRSIADDFEATDPDEEDPDDLTRDLASRIAGEDGVAAEDESDANGDPDPTGSKLAAQRRH